MSDLHEAVTKEIAKMAAPIEKARGGDSGQLFAQTAYLGAIHLRLCEILEKMDEK